MRGSYLFNSVMIRNALAIELMRQVIIQPCLRSRYIGSPGIMHRRKNRWAYGMKAPLIISNVTRFPSSKENSTPFSEHINFSSVQRVFSCRCFAFYGYPQARGSYFLSVLAIHDFLGPPTISSVWKLAPNIRLLKLKSHFESRVVITRCSTGAVTKFIVGWFRILVLMERSNYYSAAGEEIFRVCM